MADVRIVREVAVVVMECSASGKLLLCIIISQRNINVSVKKTKVWQRRHDTDISYLVFIDHNLCLWHFPLPVASEA